MSQARTNIRDAIPVPRQGLIIGNVRRSGLRALLLTSLKRVVFDTEVSAGEIVAAAAVGAYMYILHLDRRVHVFRSTDTGFEHVRILDGLWGALLGGDYRGRLVAIDLPSIPDREACLWIVDETQASRDIVSRGPWTWMSLFDGGRAVVDAMGHVVEIPS